MYSAASCDNRNTPCNRLKIFGLKQFIPLHPTDNNGT